MVLEELPRILMFTNPKAQEMQKIFDLMASKSKPVIIQQLLTHYFTIMAATSSSGTVDDSYWSLTDFYLYMQETVVL